MEVFLIWRRPLLISVQNFLVSIFRYPLIGGVRFLGSFAYFEVSVEGDIRYWEMCVIGRLPLLRDFLKQEMSVRGQVSLIGWCSLLRCVCHW